MKRTIIPRSLVDRFLAMVGVLAVLTALLALINHDYWWALGLAFSAIVVFIGAYVFQDQPVTSASANEYSSVIETIGVIGNQLSALSNFLEKEQARVANTEATVKKLQEEKTKLEPLVHTQREIVEAILSAHSERAAKHVWKERLFGFVLGLVASLIASFVYEYVKR
jgi:sensor c-di-GMP phosphodiesterase-like protein